MKCTKGNSNTPLNLLLPLLCNSCPITINKPITIPKLKSITIPEPKPITIPIPIPKPITIPKPKPLTIPIAYLVGVHSKSIPRQQVAARDGYSLCSIPKGTRTLLNLLLPLHCNSCPNLRYVYLIFKLFFSQTSCNNFSMLLKEPLLLKALMPSIISSLEHRHPHVRLNAVKAIETIYSNFNYLVPNGPELIAGVLELEPETNWSGNRTASIR